MDFVVPPRAGLFLLAWSRAGRPFLRNAAWRSFSVPGWRSAPMESAFALLLNLAAHSAIFACRGGGVFQCQICCEQLCCAAT